MDINYIFDHPEEIPADGKVIAELTQHPSLKDVACQLCRLFTTMQMSFQVARGCTSMLAGAAVQLRAFDCRTKRNLSLTDARADVVLSITLEDEPHKGPVGSRGFSLGTGLITRRMSGESELHSKGTFAARLITPKIDCNVLRGYIRLCSSEHTVKCVSDTAEPVRGLKVIDAYSRAVVQRPHGHDYVALSYVWGQTSVSVPENSQQSSAPDATTVFPALIEDAICVVKNLRLRYLWVDRYCIDQSSSEELAYMIPQMDKVYEQAIVTIAAASSESADEGLPGVNNITRMAQPAAVVGDQVYISTLPDLLNALESCKWTTRGWTYQEFILSRRCLVFTKVQVYFVCREGRWCEAVHGTLFATPSRAMDKQPGNPHFLGYTASRRVGLGIAIEQYSARTLTYEQDALNACRGLLARSTCHTYWGVPIVQQLSGTAAQGAIDPETGLALGLSWIGRADPNPRRGTRGQFPPEPKQTTLDESSQCGRRRGFPSWSWAGWSGTAKFPLLRKTQYRLMEKDSPAVWLEAEDDKRPHTPFEIAFLNNQNSRVMPETSLYLWLNAKVVRCRISRHCEGFQLLHPDHTVTRMFKLTWHPVAICKELFQDLAFEERLTTNTWNGILLFTLHYRRRTTHSHCLMLVDQKADHYESIGIAWINGKDLPDVPASRQWIRLG
jgi:hypothetical protein